MKKTTFSTTLWLKINFVLLLLACAQLCFAQLKFPQFENFEIDKKHYFRTYVPKGLFLEQFPNFSNDGKYYYDKTFPDFLANDFNFSYKDYPADLVTTTNKFKNVKKILLRNQSPYGIVYNSSFGILYDAIDNFKLGLQKMGAETVGTEFIYSNIKPNLHPVDFDRDIILEVSLVDNSIGISVLSLSDNVSRQDRKRFEDGELFPKFKLYKLVIKNRFGEILQTYGQAIFLDAGNFGGLSGKKSRDLDAELFKKTDQMALNSLLSRFLNDERVQAKIAFQNNVVQQKLTNNATYRDIINTRITLGLLDYRKELLSIACKLQKVNFDNFSSYVSSHKNSPGYVPSALNNAQTNQVAGSVASAGAGLINAIVDRSIEKDHQRDLDSLKIGIAKYDRDMQETADAIDALPASPDKEDLLKKLADPSYDLSGSLNQTLAAKSNADGAMATAKTERNALLEDLNTTMQNLLSAKNTPTSAAITSTGGGSADECSQQATTAWKNSDEYKTYMRTKLNADMKDCEAALIELTLKYCSDKLSATDKAADKKAAIEARQAAKDIRSGSGKVKL